MSEGNLKRPGGDFRTLAVLLAALLVALPPVSGVAAEVESIEFLNTASSSEILIRSDSTLEYEVQSNADDKQLVLNLKNGKLGQRARRRLDTASFDGPVSLVSPFPAEEGTEGSKVVVQLKSMVEPEIKVEDRLLRVVIPKGAAGPASTASSTAAPEPETAQAAGNDGGLKNLDTFMESQQTKRFSGRPITIQVRDAELGDVLRLIAEASGFNIIQGDGVGGKVTLSLVDVPWDQALDVLLTSRRLGAERKNNILRITTLANLTAEKEEVLRAKIATERSAPRITRVFPINFADLQNLRDTLSNFAAASANLMGAGVSGAVPVAGVAGAAASSIQLDNRTNSLIIQDTAENLEKFRKLIELLDTQTPQILIEGKVVEATEEFTKSMNGQLGFSRLNADGRGPGGAFNGAPATSGLTGSLLSPTGQRGGNLGYSPSLAFLPNLDRLNLLIGLQETDEKVKVVSSPKVVVLNRKKAKIVRATPVNIPILTTVGGGQTETPNIINAQLSLDVTPTVTNAGNVKMELNIHRDTIVNNAPAIREITTEVLVDSGSTLVIGGILTTDENNRSNGFPFLRDLPIVGWFFGGKSSNISRNELFIFVTPKILNEKDAGLISSPTEGAAPAMPNQG